MTRYTTEAFVLLPGQVPRRRYVHSRRDDVLSGVACPVARLLQEAKEGPKDRKLAASGGVAERLAVKVCQEALEVAALHLLHGQHFDALEVVDELLQIRHILSPTPSGEA